MNEELLPLFPLQMVLFPGSLLPLHIFEDRYKILIAESIRDKSEFGINLVIDEKMCEVGCTAIVKDVLRRYADEGMDIVVEGRRRYRVHNRDGGRAPYLVGSVEFLPASPDEPDPALSGDTVVLYNRLVSVVYKGKVTELPTDTIQSDLSFLLAQKAGMDLSQRQKLLELHSENERLRLIHSFLDDVVPKLERREVVNRVIHSDGYL